MSEKSHPVFPPLLTGHAVEAPLRPFSEARRHAAAGDLGAGDVIWSRGTQSAELAFVLEPDVPLARAQQMAPLTMVALGDALGAMCPPQVTIQYRWPGSILINGAEAGRLTLAAAPCNNDEVPRWLVVAARLRLVHADKNVEPGEKPDTTCLAEEGAGGVSRSEVIQSFAAYWMAALNNWLEDGFARTAEQWLFRAIGHDEPAAFTHEGRRVEGRVMGLSEEADLLIKRADGQVEQLAFKSYLQQNIDDAGTS